MESLTDIGQESGTAVVAEDTAREPVHWQDQLGAADVGADDYDHVIDPEERLRVTTARQ